MLPRGDGLSMLRPDRRPRPASGFSLHSRDATDRPPTPRDPDRGPVRGPPREDGLRGHPIRPRRCRRGPRFDQGRPRRGRVPARPRHPHRGHPRRGPRPATAARCAPDRHRADRAASSRRSGGRRSWRPSLRGWTCCPGSTRSSAMTWISPARRRCTAPASSTTAVRPSGWRRPSAGGMAREAGDPDRGDRLRHREDVRGARAAQGRHRGRSLSGVRADRSDRHDDRGLGRRGRPPGQRLHPGHGRVARRARRGARRLDPRRGAGIARPSRLLVGDARCSSTARHPRPWSWSTSPG